MHTDSSTSFTYLASASASECTATVLIPISRHARCMRSAISPRLAIRIFSNKTSARPPSCSGYGSMQARRQSASCALADDHQRMAIFHRLAVFDEDRLDHTRAVGLDLI